MTITIPASPQLEPGDVFWVDLDPVLGSEQSGRRPALVLSDSTLHGVSSRVLICPITSNATPWPTKVLIPDGCVVSGTVLVDQARMIDRRVRRLHYVGRLPDEVTRLALQLLLAFTGVR